MRLANVGIAILTTFALTAQAQQNNVTTFHYDNARLGWNSHETQLTTENVHKGSFGKLWNNPLDGMVHGSPLYLEGVGDKKQNLVYAATDNNSVYALNAETGNIVWKRTKLLPALNEAQFTGSWFGDRKHGILSTPVIDKETNTFYTCTIRAIGLRQQYEVWALDVETGTTRSGWPIVLSGSYKGTKFTPGQIMQRGALTVANGWLYIPFGGRGDIPPWRGWLMGVDLKNPTAPQRAFCASCRTDGAGIWSGGGVSVDEIGSLFAVTGNGSYDFVKGGLNLSESALRLNFDRDPLAFTGKSEDIYTPSNWQRLDDQDEDLGGATANVLPEMTGSKTPHLLFFGAKDGVAYLVNRDNLGGVGGEVQKTRLAGMPNAIYYEGIRSTSAYFDGGEKGKFILCAIDQPGEHGNNGLLGLKLNPGDADHAASFERLWTMSRPINGPSCPIVTSNGEANPITWVVECEGNGSSLLAFDVITGRELYNSQTSGAADHWEGGRRFTSPIASNGKLYIGAQGINCFGLKGRKE